MGPRPRYFAVVTLLAMALMAISTCASPPGPSTSGRSPGGASEGSGPPGQRKVLNMGLRSILDGFAISGSPSLAGGALDYIEIHSQALFTADKVTGRPIPRLVAEHPTLENGGLRITDDGRMVSTYRLRRDVKWADGVPFTARDLMFTFALTRDRSMPIVDPAPTELMDSATAPDDYTFVVGWKQPYYLADALGLTPFWPLPAHLLERDYLTIVGEQKDVQGYLAKPYWTSEYIHIGPFKLVEFHHGVEAVFDAVNHYFLGRPKVDRIVVKMLTDANTLLANILSGSVDLTAELALQIEQGVQLKERWDPINGGAILFTVGPTFFASFQFDQSAPGFHPAVLDKRLRQGLYYAIDRDTYAEAVLAGVPDRAAHALFSPEHPLYSYVKDGWKQRYPYDPARAAATLEAAGYRRGPDGVLVHAASGRLAWEGRAPIALARKLSVVSDMWRRAGVAVEETVIPEAQVRNREYRQAFPHFEVTARGNQDVLLTRLECSLSPTAQNRFSGSNRGHWCNDEFDRLTDLYRATLREEARGPIIRQLQDIILEEMPIHLLNYEVSLVVARRGVTAYADDVWGGDSGRSYGSHSRNAHEWDIL